MTPSLKPRNQSHGTLQPMIPRLNVNPGLIGVVDQALEVLASACPDRHLQRVQRQLGSHPAAEHVHHQGDVEEAQPGPHVGESRRPRAGSVPGPRSSAPPGLADGAPIRPGPSFAFSCPGPLLSGPALPSAAGPDPDPPSTPPDTAAARACAPRTPRSSPHARARSGALVPRLAAPVQTADCDE